MRRAAISVSISASTRRHALPLALVRFRPPAAVSAEQARALFQATAERYVGYAGLTRKSYFRSEDGRLVGAIYEWETRAAGEALYDEAWRARVAAHYGAEPELTWLETPVVVDNQAGEIRRSSPLPAGEGGAHAKHGRVRG